MATLTIMFPDDKGIELTISFEVNDQLMAGVELQLVCLAGETADFGDWLSESAIDLIEQMLVRENDSAFLCCMAVDYENAA